MKVYSYTLQGLTLYTTSPTMAHTLTETEVGEIEVFNASDDGLIEENRLEWFDEDEDTTVSVPLEMEDNNLYVGEKKMSQIKLDPTTKNILNQYENSRLETNYDSEEMSDEEFYRMKGL